MGYDNYVLAPLMDDTTSVDKSGQAHRSKECLKLAHLKLASMTEWTVIGGSRSRGRFGLKLNVQINSYGHPCKVISPNNTFFPGQA